MVGNYRPVSMLSSISKLFVKAVYKQLYSYLHSDKLPHDFRPENCAEFVVVELTDRAFIKIDEKQVPITIYMDLSKAFDSPDHTILLKKLSHNGISGNALR